MGKIIPFPTRSDQRDTNRALTDKQLFEQALQELHQETGIDFLKLCTGDPEENRRLRKQLERETEHISDDMS